MAVFKFKARDENYRVVSGRVQVNNRDEIEKKLIAKQLVLISATVESDSEGFLSKLFSGMSHKKLVVATRQLAFLVSASVPIVQALDHIANNSDDIQVKKVFKKLSGGVEAGSSFSEALNNFPNIFDVLYQSMVKSGEEGGSLDVVLNRLATYIEKIQAIRSKVKSSMMYPVFMVVIALAILAGIMVFLVPKFEEIFKDAGQELPMLTQMLVTMSHFVRNHYILLMAMIIGVVVGSIYFSRTPTGARIFESLFSNFPVIGPLLKKNYIANFSRTLASLLNSGVGLIDAITISGKASGSIFLKEAADRATVIIESGFNFGKAISRESIFPKIFKNMVAVGEETGSMNASLDKVADFYEEEVDAAVSGLLKLIEPMMIVVIAGMIGFILLALYLPIFSISGTISQG